ncbi:MAG: DUF4276 family protein [Prevotella sp.]|nr:DUF4276 family protein [Prevotella sp.]
MNYLHILCEGKSELVFASYVLSPYLIMKGIQVIPQALITNKRLNAKGGMISFSHAMRDLENMMRQFNDGEKNRRLFTTMFDLYALPNDFPGYEQSLRYKDYGQVEILERGFSAFVNKQNFIPYIQLHEFEALVLCNVPELVNMYPDAEKELKQLETLIVDDYNGNTELVDNGPSTAPSKRIIQALDGKYRYDKPQGGKLTTSSLGIPALRTRCRHFNDWLTKIEKYQWIRQ